MIAVLFVGELHEAPANERRELEFICDVRTNKLPSGREVSPKVTIGARASKALIISSALFIEASLSRAPFVFCYAKSTSLPEGGEYTRDYAEIKWASVGVGVLFVGELHEAPAAKEET